MIKNIFKLNIGYFIFFALIINIFLAFCLQYFFPEKASANMFENPLEEFIVVALFTPPIEVFIFQYLVIKIISNYSENLLLQIIISAILFAIVHSYSIPHIFKAFFAGLLYAGLFIIAQQKGKNAFVYVLIFHAIYNTIISLINHLFY